jgi:Ca2+-transporting ATPase
MPPKAKAAANLSVPQTLKEHKVTLAKGLSAAEVEARQSQWGRNELDQEEPTPLWKLVLEQFDDQLVQILLGAALLSTILAFMEESEDGGLALEAFVEPAVILTILILNAIVGVWQESSAESALEALKNMQSLHTPCLRDGEWDDALATEDLVPGDVVRISVGDKVPADVRLCEFQTATLRTDEAALTGESETVLKTTDALPAADKIQTQRNMCFSGTTVSGGKAICIVTSTGMYTEIGKIQSAVQEAAEDEEKTPLGQKLDKFGDQLTNVITGICLLVWVMNFNAFWDPVHGSLFKGMIYYLKIAVALGVAAIPEGLPAVITLCLSMGTRKMVRRNAIVRKLPSVETLGCCTVICSDKTGTLTTNQMVVETLVTGGTKGKIVETSISGTNYSPEEGGMEGGFTMGGSFETVADICALCNDAQIKYDADEGAYVRVGEPTEAALKVLVEKMGGPGSPSSQAERASFYSDQSAAAYNKEATLEFSRDRKSMSVLVSDAEDRHLMVKGAAELVLERCTHMMLANGKTEKMSAALRKACEAKIHDMATRPQRCLGLAMKSGMPSAEELPNQLQNIADYRDIETGLVFVGIAGIKDPARPEVKPAIAECQDAGIRVIMITGDNKETAEAIARDVGIFEEDEDIEGKSFTGSEFFDPKRSDAERSEILVSGGGNRVFSRTEPRDKQLLVKLLKTNGEVPAMTGDGVNDAPALKQASIGIAMGIAGTEVAKEASDMILADDNFATIVHAVEEGRGIYSNMKAFIRYMISSNIGEVASIFFTSAIGVPEGLIPVQLLWVNLVTDGPPATALGFNPPDPDVMKHPPRGEDDVLINNWVFFRYMVIGMYVGFATVGVFVFWFVFYVDFVNYLGPELMAKLGSEYDGHSMVTYEQLTHWGHCTAGTDLFKDFKVDDFDADGDGVIDSFAEHPCDIFTKGKVKASTLSLSVLVTIEMFNALNAISEDGSLLQIPPWVNGWLLLAMASSFVMHFVILYVPFFANIFAIAPHTTVEWMIVVAFSFPVIAIDEVLKAVGRNMNEKERAARRALQEAEKKSA